MSKQVERVMDPEYWKERLANMRGEIHRAIFWGSIDQWTPLLEGQRRALAAEIKDTDSVLDAGCAWGRILDLMPATWTGNYLGVDISHDFIRIARKKYPGRSFIVGDLRDMPFCGDKEFDVAVCLSIKPMIVRNCGQEVWDVMEHELLRVANRIIHVSIGEFD